MRKICTGVFLAILSVLFIGVFICFPWKGRIEVYEQAGGGLRGLVLTVFNTARDTTLLNDNIVGHDGFVQLFGGVQKVIGVDCVNDVYRLKNGAVTFILPELEPFDEEQLESIRSFSDRASRKGMEKLYVVMPQKACSLDYPFTARGVTDYSDSVDAYRKGVFSDAGYEVLDLHDSIHAQGLNHLDLYFLSDHHWKLTTGLWAAGQIAGALGMDTSFYAPEQYTIRTYEKLFLGSAGKHVGTAFSPVDDVELPIPAFDTQYELEIPNKEIVRKGSFSETVVFEDEAVLDYFHSMPYSILLKGDHPILTIRNKALPNGKKVLMIKDSYSNCVAPYLAATCSELVMIDPRHYKQSIAQFMEEGAFDVLLVGQCIHSKNAVCVWS